MKLVECRDRGRTTMPLLDLRCFLQDGLRTRTRLLGMRRMIGGKRKRGHVGRGWFIQRKRALLPLTHAH
jgi:hypothetical protein